MDITSAGEYWTCKGTKCSRNKESFQRLPSNGIGETFLSKRGTRDCAKRIEQWNPIAMTDIHLWVVTHTQYFTEYPVQEHHVPIEDFTRHKIRVMTMLGSKKRLVFKVSSFQHPSYQRMFKDQSPTLLSQHRSIFLFFFFPFFPKGTPFYSNNKNLWNHYKSTNQNDQATKPTECWRWLCKPIGNLERLIIGNC